MQGPGVIGYLPLQKWAQFNTHYSCHVTGGSKYDYAAKNMNSKAFRIWGQKVTNQAYYADRYQGGALDIGAVQGRFLLCRNTTKSLRLWIPDNTVQNFLVQTKIEKN